MRNEIGLDGLKITIDLKRGVDPDKLMNRLFAMTPLQDSFSCNFNILIAGVPRVMGVREHSGGMDRLPDRDACGAGCILICARAKDKLHLLRGLSKILLDIDKAVRIVRETEEESEVVPNLMIGFGIDEIQAEYVAEIKLRHLNREYILKRIEEIGKAGEGYRRNGGNPQKPGQGPGYHHRRIAGDQQKARQAPPQPAHLRRRPGGCRRRVRRRRSPDYPCTLFFTARGIFQENHPTVSAHERGAQAQGGGQDISKRWKPPTTGILLFFTSAGTVYKAKAADFGDTKASVLGDYVPSKLGFEEGEEAVYMAVTDRLRRVYALFL